MNYIKELEGWVKEMNEELLEDVPKCERNRWGIFHSSISDFEDYLLCFFEELDIDFDCTDLTALCKDVYENRLDAFREFLQDIKEDFVLEKDYIY